MHKVKYKGKLIILFSIYLLPQYESIAGLIFNTDFNNITTEKLIIN